MWKQLRQETARVWGLAVYLGARKLPILISDLAPITDCCVAMSADVDTLSPPFLPLWPEVGDPPQPPSLKA